MFQPAKRGDSTSAPSSKASPGESAVEPEPGGGSAPAPPRTGPHGSPFPLLSWKAASAARPGNPGPVTLSLLHDSQSLTFTLFLRRLSVRPSRGTSGPRLPAAPEKARPTAGNRQITCWDSSFMRTRVHTGQKQNNTIPRTHRVTPETLHKTVCRVLGPAPSALPQPRAPHLKHRSRRPGIRVGPASLLLPRSCQLRCGAGQGHRRPPVRPLR